MKSTVINALVAQIIATSKEVVGNAAKPVKAGKYASIQALWDSKDGAPFGCQSDNVATVIEGITGFRPGIGNAKLTQFDVVVVHDRGHGIDSQPAIVLSANPPTLWHQNTPTDTWALTPDRIKELGRPTKSQVDRLHAAIKENKAEFMAAARSHISLASLSLQ
jgi:hypothetical protein